MMENWFVSRSIGRYIAEKEQDFFDGHESCRQKTVVQMGAAWLRSREGIIVVPRDVKMDCTAMAWESQSLDCLKMAHSHEYSANPSLALAEAARVLKPEGKLVITGFNPYSLWGLSSWFDGRCLPHRSHCFSLPEFKRLIQTLGFEIEYGKFMVYVPPVETAGGLRFWHFLEKAGDRWWPQCAAVYGLVLIKRRAGVHLLPEVETELAEESMVLGTARTSG